MRNRLHAMVVIAALAACGKVESLPDGPPGGFTVALEPPNLFIRRGEMHAVTVTVTRDATFTGDITLTAASLPVGVTAPDLVIPAAETTGMLTLTANATAKEGRVTVSVTGTGGGGSADLALLVGGPPGTPDESFANDGTFTTVVPGMVVISRALKLSADGILVTGSTASQAITIRVTADGTLDPAFGGGGVVSTGVGSFSEGIAVTGLADGRVIVAGVANGDTNLTDYDFGLFKYTNGGALDTTFGASGVAQFNPGAGFGELHNLAVAADGSLLVGGVLFGPTGGATTRGLRFSPMGVRDATYNITEANVAVEASFLQPDNKLVMSGALAGDFWLARYNPDATHDGGFGTAGIVTTDFAPDTVNANGLVVLMNGKILAAGIGTNAMGAHHLCLARYNANGSLDLTFGVGGKVSPAMPTFDTSSPDAIIVRDGKIMMVGVSNLKPAVIRLDLDGTVDTTFGTNGVAAIDFGVIGTNQKTGGYGIAADVDGRIIIAGEVGPAGGQQLAVARLWP